MPEFTLSDVSKKNNKQNITYPGYLCSIINLPNQTSKSKTNTNKTQYSKQKSNPYNQYTLQIANSTNKYNEEYISKMHAKCRDIAKKSIKRKVEPKVIMIIIPEGKKILHEEPDHRAISITEWTCHRARSKTITEWTCHRVRQKATM